MSRAVTAGVWPEPGWRVRGVAVAKRVIFGAQVLVPWPVHEVWQVLAVWQVFAVWLVFAVWQVLAVWQVRAPELRSVQRRRR